MAYTTINKSSEHFNTKLYTGNGGTNAITGVGFQPDFVWLKSRSEASTDHKLLDAVRGAPNFISSNLTAAEASTGSFNSIDSDGFTVDTTNAAYNQSSATYASWNWKANGAGSSNTDGSITSTVSANTTSGFSIVSYTGTGSNATVGHGLGAIPKMVIIKDRDATKDWTVYHNSIGATKFIELNTNLASQTNSTAFNDTAPTNQIFNIGDGGTVNTSSNDYIAYCFADVTGYSKFGSYVGNGNADGTFIYTGFKPQLVMLKQTSGATNWAMNDIKRQQYNAQDIILYADSSGAESGYGGNYFDILSNGFKQRMSGSYYNGSGNNYIYMAFAEAPLVGSNNVPCTAR